MKARIDKQNKRALMQGVLSAVVIFATGFLIMYLLFIQWKSNNPDSTLPGFFYYKAAYIGDPICLPLLTGTLCYHHVSQGKKLFKFKKASKIIAVIAFIISIIMQAEWLINDNTRLNWTIPRPHCFNVAGWYHAFFFVAMITIVVAFLIEYIMYSISKPSVISDGIMYFSIIFFGLLHFCDDYISKTAPVFSLLGAAVILIIVSVIIKMIQMKKIDSVSLCNFISIPISGVVAFLLSIVLL